MLFKKMIKLCAVMLCILLTLPVLSLSAGAVDEISTEEVSVITDTLRAVMEENTEETTRVAIWLSDIDTEEALATNSMPDAQARLAYVQSVEANSTETNEIDRSIEVKRAALRYCYEAYTADFAERILSVDESIYASPYVPSILANLSNDRIEVIATLPEVESIDYYNDKATPAGETTEVTPYSSTMYYNVDQQIGYVNALDLRDSVTADSGSVSIGILDTGMPDKAQFSDIPEDRMFLHYDTEDILPVDHPTYIGKILTTMVPYASFYFASYCCASDVTDTSNLYAEVTWLLESGVNIVNVSMTLGEGWLQNQDTPSSYGMISKFLDYITHTYGLIIVQASGNRNNDAQLRVNSGAMAYNVITVGNYNRTTSSINVDSCYYNGTGLAYKPDICAPGSFVFVLDNLTHTGDGTSFSAPLVSGIIALLLMKRESLKEQYPATIKAIIVAATKSNCSFLPSDSQYRQYGAGVIDGGKAWEIVDSNQYFKDYAGIATGEYVERSISLNSATPVRLAMSYPRHASGNGISFNTVVTVQNLPNIDIAIYDADGNEIAYSRTLYNNVEILEFTPENYYYGEDYTLRITITSRNNSPLTLVNVAWHQ